VHAAWLGRVGYLDALARQRALHAAVVAGEEPDTVLLLEHEGVYTAGRRTAPDERPADPTIPVLDVDRGGKITWHGPGQLVGYPVMHLSDPVDVVAYVRRIEATLMVACADLGLATTQIPGRSGVWTSDGRRKVGAIGIRVSQGVTMHGFALNADPDLGAYEQIVACGIHDATVTSLAVELGRDVTVDEARAAVDKHLEALV
jgi:lipoyl(octanoyl) transferase